MNCILPTAASKPINDIWMVPLVGLGKIISAGDTSLLLVKLLQGRGKLSFFGAPIPQAFTPLTVMSPALFPINTCMIFVRCSSWNFCNIIILQGPYTRISHTKNFTCGRRRTSYIDCSY